MSKTVTMRCVCGAKIPEDSPKYPIKHQRVVKTSEKGDRVVTYEDYIVICPDKINHPPDTAYNYVEQAKERAVYRR